MFTLLIYTAKETVLIKNLHVTVAWENNSKYIFLTYEVNTKQIAQAKLY
jgi:hypothetical protein